VYPVLLKVIKLTVIPAVLRVAVAVVAAPLLSKIASLPFTQLPKAVPVLAVLQLWLLPPPVVLQLPLAS
jgi:hypothetical protein